MTDIDPTSTIPVLDLEMLHFRRRHGDIEAFGTWYGPENRPCLVLMRRGDYGADTARVTPCIFPQANAWIFSEEIGDPREAVHSLASMAHHLGLSAFQQLDMFRLLSIVRENLQDWITIPPKPKDKVEVKADAILTDRTTGKEKHAEIMGDV